MKNVKSVNYEDNRSQSECGLSSHYKDSLVVDQLDIFEHNCSLCDTWLSEPHRGQTLMKFQSFDTSIKNIFETVKKSLFRFTSISMFLYQKDI